MVRIGCVASQISPIEFVSTSIGIEGRSSSLMMPLWKYGLHDLEIRDASRALRYRYTDFHAGFNPHLLDLLRMI
jgi:hypothetical protein